jgi:glycosyltransferase involved in cell wall biosynthesis
VLGERIVWLTPAMKVYYDVGGRTWLGCQPNYLIPPSAAAVRARRGGSLRVGGIGALVPWKGWRLMVEALALLPAADRARVTFQHLGSVDASAESAEYARELRARARNLGLDGQITWRGEEVSSAALLGEIDVLLVSSDGEPFSMALLEAWAAGVPVLAADGAGPAELITVRRDGWLFARGSAADLAEMISALLRDEAWTAVRPALPESGPTAARWRALYAEVLG